MSLPSRFETVVVGGGLAGLSAALALRDAGRSCLLLEARGRVGGRVHTIRSPFADDLHAEAGAEYINGGHTHVQAMLRRYGLLNGQAPTAPRMYDLLGQRAIGTTVAAFGPAIAADLRRLGRHLSSLGRQVPDPLRPWEAPAANELDARSVREWLDGLDLSPITATYLNVWNRLDYSIENDRISLLQLARDERLYRDDPARSVGRPAEGMDTLPRAMATELGESVLLNSAVRGVHQSAHEVTVTYHTPDGEHELSADRLIFAVPLTVLRQISLTPALPEAHRAAIQSLGYGTVVKVLMQFRERFWHDERKLRGVMTDRPFLSAWDATRDQAGPRGILGTYTAGENGRRLAAMSEDMRIQWCLGQLDELFPSASRLFELGVSAVWDNEAFTRGTYSYFAPGEMVRYAPELARPAGRIHFAGEHTDAWQATMNGAISSGLRAANEVLADGSRSRGPT